MALMRTFWENSRRFAGTVVSIGPGIHQRRQEGADAAVGSLTLSGLERLVMAKRLHSEIDVVSVRRGLPDFSGSEARKTC